MSRTAFSNIEGDFVTEGAGDRPSPPLTSHDRGSESGWAQKFRDAGARSDELTLHVEEGEGGDQHYSSDH